MKFNLNRTHKIIISTLLVFILAVFGFVSWAGSRAADYVKEQVAKQTFLQGKLEVADVGAALSGDVWVSNVTWHDPEGRLVAKIPRLNLSVRLNDIFGGGLRASSIDLITLERPELYLSYRDKEGLNIINLLTIEPKVDKEGKPLVDGKKGDGNDKPFRGTLAIEKGLLQIESGKNKLVYENFDCKLQYNNFPQVSGMVQAKQNKADFAGNMEITYTEKGEVVKLNVEGRSILLTDFFNMITVASNFKVTDGNISSIKASIELEPDQPDKMNVEGAFSNLAAESMGIKVSSFKGSFKGNQDEVVFTGIDGKVNDQPVQINGKVNIKQSPYKLDLSAQSTSFKLNSLSPGISVTDPFAFNAEIKGVSDKPKVKGTFSAAAVTTEQLSLANVNGKFAYEEGLVKLDDISAGAFGGSINASGNILTTDQSFKFNVHGSGINSSSMTSSNINGPLAFTTYATGTGATDATAVNGNFAIGKGDFNGIPFNSMTGNFAKYSGGMSFSNVVVNTFAGSVSTNAYVQPDGKIRFDNLDVSNLSEENIKESFKDKAKEELEKGKGKISDALKKIF